MQKLTPYFERSLGLVSKISPEQNTDFHCPYPKLEMYQKGNRFSRLRNADVIFCIFARACVLNTISPFNRLSSCCNICLADFQTISLLDKPVSAPQQSIFPFLRT